MSDLLRPQDLRKITRDVEVAKQREVAIQRQKEEEEERAMRDAFMSRDLHPEVKTRINSMVSHAATKGATEMMVLSFPASYCNDGGLRIRNGNPDWPESLQGYAQAAMHYYDQELKPLGYKVHTRILAFPGGATGTIGLFLSW